MLQIPQVSTSLGTKANKFSADADNVMSEYPNNSRKYWISQLFRAQLKDQTCHSLQFTTRHGRYDSNWEKRTEGDLRLHPCPSGNWFLLRDRSPAPLK